MPVLHIDPELSFDGFAGLDASFDVIISCFISPMRVEREWDALRNSKSYLPLLRIEFF